MWVFLKPLVQSRLEVSRRVTGSGKGGLPPGWEGQENQTTQDMDGIHSGDRDGKALHMVFASFEWNPYAIAGYQSL